MNQNRTNLFLLSSVCLAFVWIAISCNSNEKKLQVPIGWYQTWVPSVYEIGMDEGVQLEGNKVATIKCTDAPDTGDCGIMAQYCSVDAYRGKRIRLKGSIQTKDVTGWAGFWMRIDQPDSARMQYFDNMEDRGVKATTGWREYEIVLDVPADAKAMGFGALLNGAGQMWFGKMSIDEVGTDVPVTGKQTGTYILTAAKESKNDTLDYQHTNKAELERNYKTSRFEERVCGPEATSILTGITNLSFDK
ncbi:MAG: hypothetical protein V4590_01085 [Bacteroidota bacterium]